MYDSEVEKLAEDIINFRHDQVKKKLNEIEKSSDCEKRLADYRYKQHENENDETLLHLITKYDDKADLVKKVVSLCPSLLTETAKSDEYKGQTALHIAISKQNIKAVRAMLKYKNTRTQLLSISATGSRFRYTVMMGELPLSVAALNFDEQMVKLLIDNGAKIALRNSYGDTVFHSLVKYSYCHSDNQEEVIKMMAYLNAYLDKGKGDKKGVDEESDPVAVWFYPNYEKCTPLLLASQLGESEIFKYILNLDDVYCRLHKHDGLFDIKRYDITEIDTVSMLRWLQNNHEEKKSSKNISDDIDIDSFVKYVSKNKTRFNQLGVTEIKGVLERISELDTKTAFEFVKLAIIREVIKKKWLEYRLYYYLWGIFHLMYITGITSYAILRTKQHSYSNKTNQTSSQTEANFVTAIGSLNLIIPILYLLMEGKCLYERKWWNFRRIHHNGTYHLLLVLFSLTTFVDALWYFIQPGSPTLLSFQSLLDPGSSHFSLEVLKNSAFSP